MCPDLQSQTKVKNSFHRQKPIKARNNFLAPENKYYMIVDQLKSKCMLERQQKLAKLN